MEGGVVERDVWLADVLGTVATLYAAAPVVREVGLPEGGRDIPAGMRVGNDLWDALYKHLTLVLGADASYSSHFNPTGASVGDEAGVGDLADDLADIYRDLKPGVLAWNTGEDLFLEDVLFQWVHYGHVHHWGRHAVDAMRALHWLVYK
jgi:hypothetical protein